MLGTRFQIPLRRFYSFWFNLGLIVSAHPLQVSVQWFVKFHLYFCVCFNILGRIVLWYKIGWCFVKYPSRFFTCLPEYVDLFWSESIMHLIKFHFNSSGYCFCRTIFSAICCRAAFATGVGVCGLPISYREVHIDVDLDSSWIIAPVQLLRWRTWHCVLCWILHVLVHFLME